MNMNDQKRYDAFKDEYCELIEKHYPDETGLEPLAVHAQFLGIIIGSIDPSIASRERVMDLVNYYISQSVSQVEIIAAEDGST